MPGVIIAVLVVGKKCRTHYLNRLPRAIVQSENRAGREVVAGGYYSCQVDELDRVVEVEVDVLSY